ncbi:MAG: thiamine pyrophosphate-dependent enzyme [bacterium]|nr:thiamine pyrophosphate-dependent enzyme [bacterium]
MPNLKELSKNAGLFTGGHRACAGCGGTVVINQALCTAGKNTVVCFATGCMEVVTTIYPYTAWGLPYAHLGFENSAAIVSGVEATYKALKQKGQVKEDWNFIAFGGDGGTYDIGLQALSGAIERGHKFLYICYDNQAYMNTGIQRSSATPTGANTTTSPAGTKIQGKVQRRKNLTEIIAAHDTPYVAQANPAYWMDFTKKVEKALKTDGPSFINVLAPCPLGWGFSPNKTIEIGKLAAECKFWPMYEVENGKYTLTYKPKKEMKVEEWMKLQKRFSHLFKEGNKELLTNIQKDVDTKWETLLKKCE